MMILLVQYREENIFSRETFFHSRMIRTLDNNMNPEKPHTN